MGCNYVKDFDFGPQKTQVRGYARGGPVKKDCPCGPTKKAKGGVVEKETGERYASRAAMDKHEASESPTERKAEAGMPLPKRKGVPVASMSPLIVIAMDKGKRGK